MMGDLASEREAEILLRCREGDWSDYGEIVERYQPLVWAAVDAATSDKASIPDLVQEVFVKAFEKMHTFRSGSRLSSWLYRIARNHALNHSRKFRGAKRTVSLEDASLNSGYEIAGTLDEPDTVTEAKARKEALDRMICRLPEHYRVVLNMYSQGEMTYESISDALEIPLNTVRTHIRRARLKLAEYAEQEGWK
jgi:RNA polymerase sigma-70 factor (ECF subfamily)